MVWILDHVLVHTKNMCTCYGLDLRRLQRSCVEAWFPASGDMPLREYWEPHLLPALHCTSGLPWSGHVFSTTMCYGAETQRDKDIVTMKLWSLRKLWAKIDLSSFQADYLNLSQQGNAEEHSILAPVLHSEEWSLLETGLVQNHAEKGPQCSMIPSCKEVNTHSEDGGDLPRDTVT
jgi:hypothetical protein